MAVCHDVDEFADAQPNWSLHYEQLSTGRFVGRLEHIQLPGMRMVQETANCSMWQRGQLGEHNIGLAVPLRLPGHGTFNGQPLTAETLMIGRAEELDLCLPADSAMIGIVVDAELLGGLWEHLYHKRMSSWIDRQVVATARHGLADVVRTIHLRVMADLEATPKLLQEPSVLTQMRDAVLIEWIEALPTRITTDGLSSGEARRRVVARACELMHAHESEPLSILQVCKLLGASPTKLDFCFRKVLGITPAKYMRSIRLNGVRRELLRSHQGSVQDVAARWGFWHLGEFAATYRRQFGELPSQTLRG
jgi:AraC family transcriptional regulator, ethanolamine operon transcriptional activator